ncbi:MAG TPA: hypothetical protein P5567_00415 [Kiritimatiellia bacterium]|nr:hypothetical protein [Kiritimatiellia bacterium]HRZ10897.1 hypothetical protein [Kiritimatiellia bacterium]HSA18830.1 hypothetical protein [Kiritimatiellia bacterium]
MQRTHSTPTAWASRFLVLVWLLAGGAAAECGFPSDTAGWLVFPRHRDAASPGGLWGANQLYTLDHSLAIRSTRTWSNASGQTPFWDSYWAGGPSFDPEGCRVWMADGDQRSFYTVDIVTGSRHYYTVEAAADRDILFDKDCLWLAYDWIRERLWVSHNPWIISEENHRIMKFRIEGTTLVKESDLDLQALGYELPAGPDENGIVRDSRSIRLDLVTGDLWVLADTSEDGYSTPNILLSMDGQDGRVKCVLTGFDPGIDLWDLNEDEGSLWASVGNFYGAGDGAGTLLKFDLRALPSGVYDGFSAAVLAAPLSSLYLAYPVDMAVSRVDGALWIWDARDGLETGSNAQQHWRLARLSATGALTGSSDLTLDVEADTGITCSDFIETTANGGCIAALAYTLPGGNESKVRTALYDAGLNRTAGWREVPIGTNWGFYGRGAALPRILTPPCLPPLAHASTDRPRYRLGETVRLTCGALLRCEGVRQLAWSVRSSAGTEVGAGAYPAPGGCSYADATQTVPLAGLPLGVYTATVVCTSCGSLPTTANCVFEILAAAPPRPTVSILREPYITAYGNRQDVRFRLRADAQGSLISELRWWAEDTNGVRAGAEQNAPAWGRSSYNERHILSPLPPGDYYLKARLASDWGDVVEAASGRFRVWPFSKEARAGFDPDRYVILRYSDTCVPVAGWAAADNGLSGYGVRWEGYGLAGDALPWRSFSAGWEPTADYWEPGCWPIPDAIWPNAQTQDVAVFYLVGQAGAAGSPGIVSNRLAVILMCPLEEILGLESAATKSAREFRDLFLKKSKDGKALADLYYKHARELSGLVAKQPALAKQAGALVTAALPDIAALLKSGKPTRGPWAKENVKLVNAKTIAAARNLLAKTKPCASAGLRAALNDLINKLDAAVALR